MRLSPLLLLLALGGACVPLRAQTQAPQNTVITSTTFEMWNDGDEAHSVFEGNVVVTATNLRITCDKLTVLAHGMSNDKTAAVPKTDRVKYLLATGKVHIVQDSPQGSREASCERAEVFPLPVDDKIVLTGNPVVIDNAQNFVATGDPLILLRGERSAKDPRVSGTNVKITLPPIKDLSEKAPGTAPAAPASDATAKPADAPTPTAPATDAKPTTPPSK